MELEFLEHEESILFNVWVTCNCNYACDYCYEGRNKTDSYMDIPTADQIIDFMIQITRDRGLDCISINFHGGEPTLNFQIIKYIVSNLRKYPSLKMFTSMTTNCSVYIGEAARYLDEISVSIDGKKETNDRNRKLADGSGTFDISFRNAAKYLRTHPNVKVNMVVTAFNASELYENIAFLIQNGFKHIMPSIDFFDPAWNEEAFETLYLQLKRIKKEFCLHETKGGVTIGIFNSLISTKKRCIVGMDQFQIMTDGNLYPCAIVVGVPDYCFGNVKTGIDEQKVEQLNELMEPGVNECTDCSYYDCCMTCRCYFINKVLTGSMYSPSGVVCASEHLKVKLKRA